MKKDISCWKRKRQPQLVPQQLPQQLPEDESDYMPPPYACWRQACGRRFWTSEAADRHAEQNHDSTDRLIGHYLKLDGPFPGLSVSITFFFFVTDAAEKKCLFL
jgi:hypothetical protein